MHVHWLQVVAVLSTMDVKQLDEGLLDDCLRSLACMLQDDCYAARQYAALVIANLYTKWADTQVMPPACTCRFLLGCRKLPQNVEPLDFVDIRWDVLPASVASLQGSRR